MVLGLGSPAKKSVSLREKRACSEGGERPSAPEGKGTGASRAGWSALDGLGKGRSELTQLPSPV